MFPADRNATSFILHIFRISTLHDVCSLASAWRQSWHTIPSSQWYFLEDLLSFCCLCCSHPGWKAADTPGLQRGLSEPWMRTAQMHQNSMGSHFWEEHEKLNSGWWTPAPLPSLLAAVHGDTKWVQSLAPGQNAVICAVSVPKGKKGSLRASLNWFLLELKPELKPGFAWVQLPAPWPWKELGVPDLSQGLGWVGHGEPEGVRSVWPAQPWAGAVLSRVEKEPAWCGDGSCWASGASWEQPGFCLWCWVEVTWQSHHHQQHTERFPTLARGSGGSSGKQSLKEWVFEPCDEVGWCSWHFLTSCLLFWMRPLCSCELVMWVCWTAFPVPSALLLTRIKFWSCPFLLMTSLKSVPSPGNVKAWGRGRLLDGFVWVGFAF